MKNKKYETMKGFLNALNKKGLDTPKIAIKGKGNLRFIVSKNLLNALKDFTCITEWHLATVFARRYGNYGATYAGTSDEQVCSAEINEIIKANKENCEKIEKLYLAKIELKNLNLI